ncbi:hypothetical protein ACFQJ7_07835 [Halovenus rubra]|uniref:Uncharacterized protein n=2 Tax=Halovenus rubra TaxID=869890 RepID=A0ACC7E5D4_9EURY|nr:hypothetical protein [Halovenus rubra]
MSQIPGKKTATQHSKTADKRRPLSCVLYTFVRSAVQTASFWGAVVLPFLSLPLLLTGIDSHSGLLAFLVLLVTNVVALLVGHTHRK